MGLLIFPVLIGGARGLAILFGSPTPEFPVVAEAVEAGAPLPVFLLIAFVVIFFTSGPLYVFPALDVDAAELILFGLYFLAVGYIIWQYGSKSLTKA